MSIPDGYKAIGVIVPIAVHRRLHKLAQLRETSVSKMLADWLISGIDAPIVKTGKMQKIRKNHDELFLSLPRDWMRRSGVEKGACVMVSYSDDALIIHPL